MFRKLGLPLLLASAFALSPVVLAAAPASTSQSSKAGQWKVVDATNLSFATSGSAITAETRKALAAVAKRLAAHPAFKVTLLGYTDSMGTVKSNIRLGKARANRIKNALVALGVDPSRFVEVSGRGASDPLGDNKTEAGRQLNRRVELRVMGPADAVPAAAAMATEAATMAPTEEATAMATPMASNGNANEWQGFHVGVNAIYAMGASDLNTDVSDGDGEEFNGEAGAASTLNQLGQDHSKAGDLAEGVDAGYDWQIKCLVLGLDAEFSSIALSESSNGIALAEDGEDDLQVVQSLRTDWSAALRPHIGLAFGDFLLEGNAGISVVHATYTENFSDLWEDTGEGVADSRYMLAPVFGAEARYHITPNWVAKADFSFAKYEQSELGSQPVENVNVTDQTGPTGDSLWHSFNLTVETLSLGLDYQF